MLAQLLVSGIAQGAIYALVALAMTVIYRATTVVNFGHGDLLMAGAFSVYVFVVLLGIPYLVAAGLGLLLLFVFGYLVQRQLIQPMLDGPHLALAMMAIAVGFALRGIARIYWGREVLPFPRIFPADVYVLGDVVVTSGNLIVTGVALTLMLVLFAVFYLSPVGKLAQAVFQSARGAALVGINVPRFYSIAWGVGAAMAALGGILIAPMTFLYPDMSVWILIRGFAAMTLGGFGSLHGAVVGGLLLGVMELLLGAYVSSSLIEITSYLVIILVLLFRPAGLFGQRQVVRV